jgi:hypothetical protein
MQTQLAEKVNGGCPGTFKSESSKKTVASRVGRKIALWARRKTSSTSFLLCNVGPKGTSRISLSGLPAESTRNRRIIVQDQVCACCSRHSIGHLFAWKMRGGSIAQGMDYLVQVPVSLGSVTWIADQGEKNPIRGKAHVGHGFYQRALPNTLRAYHHDLRQIQLALHTVALDNGQLILQR